MKLKKQKKNLKLIVFKKMKNNLQMRDFFINKISQKFNKKNFFFISNDQGAESLDNFRIKYKKNFINAGISEQNIISLSAGIASRGVKVFIYSISSFITLRCLEQIKIDLNIMKLPVVILGVGSSCSYDTAGPTHHSVEDIALLRSFPYLKIFSPSDNNVLSRIFYKCLSSKNPIFVRLDRQKLPILGKCNSKNFKDGFRVFGKKTKIAILSTGVSTHIAEHVRNQLKKLKIDIFVIDIFNITDFNKKKILSNIKNTNFIVSLEENYISGGLGTIISEILTDNQIKIKFKRKGLSSNTLYNYDKREIIQKNKIDKDSICKLIEKECKKNLI